jgi:hypothetical protein
MPSSGLLHHLALIRTNVLEHRITSIIRVARISKLVTANIVSSPPVLITLMMEPTPSSKIGSYKSHMA